MREGEVFGRASLLPSRCLRLGRRLALPFFSGVRLNRSLAFPCLRSMARVGLEPTAFEILNLDGLPLPTEPFVPSVGVEPTHTWV